MRKSMVVGVGVVVAVLVVASYSLTRRDPGDSAADSSMPASSSTPGGTAGVSGETGGTAVNAVVKNPVDFSSLPVGANSEKGLKWLASVQGSDGGWGQDGGEVSNTRQGVKPESPGHDVANTCVATLAFMRAGNSPANGAYKTNVAKGLDFVVARVEESPAEGLGLTTKQGTQVQRKLGPHIDTFMAGMLLAEADGNMADAQSNARVRAALKKVVAKIEKNQSKDGSWNVAGGWAPLLGTCAASRSLSVASAKGVAVSPDVNMKLNTFTANNLEMAKAESSGSGGARASFGSRSLAAGSAGVVGGKKIDAASFSSGAAGVKLYQLAQASEQLNRAEYRDKYKKQLDEMTTELSSDETIRGFGSMGGEEFFSYLNVSDSLRRTGGEAWEKWNKKITAHVNNLQNADGTWAGHHCITGRVACTGAAILTLLAERAPGEEVSSR